MMSYSEPELFEEVEFDTRNGAIMVSFWGVANDKHAGMSSLVSLKSYCYMLDEWIPVIKDNFTQKEWDHIMRVVEQEVNDYLDKEAQDYRASKADYLYDQMKDMKLERGE